MKNILKKSFLFSTTIAVILAMVVGFYMKNIQIAVIFIALNLLILVFLHYYLDNRYEDFKREIFTYIKGYDAGVSEDYEDISDILKAILANNVKMQNKINILDKKLQEFKNITSNMEEGFIVFDTEGRVELINQSAQNFLKVDKNVVFDNLVDNKDYRLAIKEAKLLGKSKSLALDIYDKNLKFFLDPIYTDSKMGFVIIIVDYSASRKAEIMRREFSGNVTHELKSPLTSINGYAELIATGLAKDEDVREFAKIIYDEGNRLLDIIDDILRLTRLDENGYELDKSYFDVRDLADQLIKKYKTLSDEKLISVSNNLAHFSICTNKSLFSDLLVNIYENAIKYNKKSGTIELSAILLEKSYRIFIRDTGIGISEEDSKRIFERFYVADKSRARNHKSTGLGLSIVKHIADFLQIDVSVSSKIGEGTTFIIDIPINE